MPDARLVLPADQAILTEEQARKRDRRMLIALVGLIMLTQVCVVFAWRLATLVGERSRDAWPLAYALYGMLGLIFVGLSSLGYVLGKRSWSLKAGVGGFEGSSAGGDNSSTDIGAANGTA